jgi:hypothetical protein
MTKTHSTKLLIERGIRHYPNSVLAWSGGKDSMVLLHIMRSMGINLPLIFFREPWQPSKYEFQDQLIREWDLLVYTWHPTESAFTQNEDEFEVQNLYFLNSTSIKCPTGIIQPSEGKPWVCSLDILNRPKQVSLQVPDVSAVWIGHKGCDSNQIYGPDAGTRVEARIVPNMATMLFPLKDWSHQDVWNYIEEHNVPFDSKRYSKLDGVWSEKEGKAHSIDNIHACTACIDRRQNAAKFVHCPKLGMRIENISASVPWANQEKLTYMKD